MLAPFAPTPHNVRVQFSQSRAPGAPNQPAVRSIQFFERRRGMRPTFIRPLVLFSLLLLLASPMLAQVAGTTSSLQGKATTDGKPLPGVTVTVSSPALQGVRTTVTGEGGGYTFAALPPGAYNVTFELEGMQKSTHKVTLA